MVAFVWVGGCVGGRRRELVGDMATALLFHSFFSLGFYKRLAFTVSQSKELSE